MLPFYCSGRCPRSSRMRGHRLLIVTLGELPILIPHYYDIILLYCIVLYCIVLCWWGRHCCPMHYDRFKIYCAPPNLGITRTWICRLNFAQRFIFSGLRFFNEPEISNPQLKVPPGGLVLRNFTSWKKFIDLSRVWTHEPWILRRARYPETTEADITNYILTKL